MTLISRLCRFVDWDLGKVPSATAGNLSVLVGVLLFVPALATGSPIALLLGTFLCLAWLLFVGWRWWRLFRATALRGDRKFDRVDKYKQPPEYVGSESVTNARRRKHAERKAR